MAELKAGPHADEALTVTGLRVVQNGQKVFAHGKGGWIATPMVGKSRALRQDDRHSKARSWPKIP